MTGREGLVGELAQARTPLDPEGSVFVKGEFWESEAVDGPIEVGEKVEIVSVDGFRLRVRKAPRD